MKETKKEKKEKERQVWRANFVAFCLAVARRIIVKIGTRHLVEEMK